MITKAFRTYRGLRETTNCVLYSLGKLPAPTGRGGDINAANCVDLEYSKIKATVNCFLMRGLFIWR